MHLQARIVLDDCRLAQEMLEAEQDTDKWRVLWAGGVALLRIVGHVLHKVDCQNPDLIKFRLGENTEAAFKRWKLGQGDDRIFTEFIERERNNILKEYRSSFEPGNNTLMAVVSAEFQPEIFEVETDLFRPIIEGFGEGEDARDIYAMAIDWWEKELVKIETLSAETT